MFTHKRIKAFLIVPLLFLLLLPLILSSCFSNLGDKETVLPSIQEKNSNNRIASIRYTFGIVYPMPHELYEMITVNAEQAAKTLGVRLIVKAPDEANLEQQVRMMEMLIKQGVDAIAIDPIDPVTLTPVINKAVEAGIEVICFESDAPGSKRQAFLGSDNKDSGVQIGQLLSQLMKGKGMVLIESGMKDMLALRQRLKGLEEYIHKETEIQILEVKYNEGSAQKALSDMEEMIEDHPHFDALVSLDVISGSNSILIWKAKGLSRYAVTFGMTPEINEALHNGQITASVSHQEYEWGQQIVELLIDSQNKSIAAFHDTGTYIFEKRLHSDVFRAN